MGLMDTYRHYWIESADPEMYSMSLYASILWVPIISTSYLYFTLCCGPRFMKSRKPYPLTTFMQYYNIFQVVLNAIMVYKSIITLWPLDTTMYCKTLRYASPEKYQMVLWLMWYILPSKLTDYADTCVFVLRKKDKQITFLHLYHHVSTVMFTWLGGRYFVTTITALAIAINSTVHVLMYTYYLLTTVKSPIVQKILRPIKPIITNLQMVQLIYFIYLGVLSITRPDCYISKTISIISMFVITINLILFGNFYIKNYWKKKTA